jgi:hypothetical protein
MRASEILQEQFEDELRPFHLARLRVLFAAVFALFRCGRLSLTTLGRAIAEATTHKHGIKRVDRLLGNVVLQATATQLAFYRAIAKRLVCAGSRPVVAVDWTAVTPKLWALTAAVPVGGRALTIYAESHPISRYLKPAVNAEFLRRLATVLPSCRPIIVADAGFRTPFMKLVDALGWDYVVRVRGSRGHTVVLSLDARRYVGDSRAEARWKSLDRLYALATRVPRDLGLYLIGRRVKYESRLVAVHKRGQRIVRGLPRASGEASKARRAAKEPWILATSLMTARPKQVVRIYAQRMQIEETYRDAKCERFGFALSQARTGSEHRANLLLLIAAIAHLFAVLLGVIAETLRIDRQFQANTIRRRRVNSFASLGRYVMQTPAVLALVLQKVSWRLLRVRVQVA